MSDYFIIRVCNFLDGLASLVSVVIFVAMVALWCAVGAKLL